MLASRKIKTPLSHAASLWPTVAVLLLAACVPNMEAQVTNKVVIAMDEPCSSTAPNAIVVVLTAGNQTVRFLAKRADSSGVWSGKRPDDKTFPADRVKASLRLQGSRTGCERSFAAANDEKEDVAKFIFHCDQRGTRNVNITTDGSVRVSYARQNPGCVEEIEQATFVGGSHPHTVGDIWVPGEELSLKIAPETQGVQGRGLLVLSLDGVATNWPLFSSDPDNSALLVFDNGGRRQKGTVGTLTLKRGEVATIFIKQRFPKGWQLSGNASSIEDKRLEKAGLKTVTLQVQ